MFCVAKAMLHYYVSILCVGSISPEGKLSSLPELPHENSGNFLFSVFE